jgi:hypothetical protein
LWKSLVKIWYTKKLNFCVSVRRNVHFC